MANKSKVTIDYMVKKNFKKESGYDRLTKKIYEKAKSAKAKNLTANITLAKMTFQAGKGKPPVPSIDNTKIKLVKKGPAKDKVVVLATEGNAKKKTFLYGLRFENEDGAKAFYEVAKLKGVKAAEEVTASAPAPESQVTIPSPMAPARSPPPPLTPSTPTHSRANSITRSMTEKRIVKSRQSSMSSRPAFMQRRNSSLRSISSRTSVSNLQSAAPLPRSRVSPSPSPIMTPATKSPMRPLSQQNTTAKPNRRSSTSSSSSSSSSSYSKRQKSAPPKQVINQAYQEYYQNTRTTYISTDPNDRTSVNGKLHHRRRRQAPRPASSQNGMPSNDSETGTHKSRKSAESVRILQISPGKNQNRSESGRMFYYTTRLASSSSSSSRSSSSSSSSSESIATRWLRDPSASSGKQGRTSSYKVRSGQGDFVQFTPRDYKSVIEPRTRRSSSSSSSSRSSSSSSRSPRMTNKWRIQKIASARSSSSSSSSSSDSSISGMGTYRASHQKNRSKQRQTTRRITPR